DGAGVGSSATTGASPAAASAASAGAPTGGLRVRVSLAPALAAGVDGDAVVFVMARAPDGPPMPVAAERHPVSALPLDIVLDDGDSPMPTQKLSQLDAAVVSARISTSGTVDRSANDLESAPVRVSLPATDA